MKIVINKRILFIAAAMLVLNAVLFWFAPKIILSIEFHLLPYSHKWVAVYLLNDQTVYGHISAISRDTIKLQDVYYLAAVEVGDQKSVTLRRRGDGEISLPENALFINRSQVLYFEKMREDSQVIKLIQEQKK